MGMLLMVLGWIAAIAGAIIIIIAAFKKSVLTGILCLFVPLYIFYFALVQFKSQNKGKVLALWLGGNMLVVVSFFLIGATFIMKGLPEIQKMGQDLQIQMNTTPDDTQEEPSVQWFTRGADVEPEPEIKVQVSQPVSKPISKTISSPVSKLVKTVTARPRTTTRRTPVVRSTQTQQVESQPEVKTSSVDIVHLKDKTRIEGRIVKETDDRIDLEISMDGGRAVLQFFKDAEIAKIERAGAQSSIQTVPQPRRSVRQEPVTVVSGAGSSLGVSSPAHQTSRQTVRSSTSPAVVASTAVWKSDLSGASIPDSSAQGSLHGQQFICEKAEFQSNILTLSQGKDFIPDLSVTIFIFTKEGEETEGNTINVKPSDGYGSPHVHMGGSKAPKTETFMKDYSMRLELGTASGGKLPGKIYICIPDDDKSFVAGRFTADVK